MDAMIWGDLVALSAARNEAFDGVAADDLMIRAAEARALARALRDAARSRGLDELTPEMLMQFQGWPVFEEVSKRVRSSL